MSQISSVSKCLANQASKTSRCMAQIEEEKKDKSLTPPKHTCFNLLPNGFVKKYDIKSFLISYELQNINVNDDGNTAGSGQQSVSINNAHKVASVDNNNGWDSWNSLWDYENGFVATRLFAKKLCIVHKMNNEAMPSLQALDALVKEKGKGPGGPPPKVLRYSVNSNQVDDLTKFGQNIAGMCQGLPTYVAEETPGEYSPMLGKTQAYGQKQGQRECLRAAEKALMDLDAAQQPETPTAQSTGWPQEPPPGD
ncbi:gastrokine-1 [Erethizon dorsatum]